MKTLVAAATALALILPALAEAGPKGNGNGNGRGNGNGAWAEGEFCPPGLRNRDPACVPPGQARRDGGEDEDRDEDERDDGEDLADRVDREIEELVDEVDLSRDEARALAIVGGLMGLALQQQRARAAPAEEAAPTVARLAIPEAPPPRPSWIERLAPTLLGDAALDDSADPVAATRPAAAPTALAPLGSMIPPPPPMAEDVGQLLGGSVTDGGF